MRLRLKDLVATILFAAIAVPYAGYLISGEMPFIKDPRGMSATGLVLGAVAYLVMRRDDLFDRIGKAEAALAGVPAIAPPPPPPRQRPPKESPRGTRLPDQTRRDAMPAPTTSERQVLDPVPYAEISATGPTASTRRSLG